MPLYLVTGQSGTGKTTLLHEFRNREIIAYGTDEDGIAKHRFIETGQFLTKEDYKAGDSADFDWLHDVGYYIDPHRISELKTEAKTQSVFLLGGAHDLDNYYDYFSIIFGLVLNEEVLKHRIQSRKGNAWGKKPHELKHILENREKRDNELKSIGAVIVDASLPVSEVADFILDNAD